MNKGDATMNAEKSTDTEQRVAPLSNQGEKVTSDSIDRSTQASEPKSKIMSIRPRLINGGLIVTAVALGLSVFQVWQSREAEREIKNISKSISTQYAEIRSISESISTQYL